LLRARQALEQEGRSVGEAADIAGYTSAANFATAFKRHFGITPRQCREGF
jgi:AraC-like DNA-binding protein